MAKKKGDGQNHTRGTDGTNIRPWTAGIEAPHPACRTCTWVHMGGVFKLKFVNRACRKHGKLI